jgi:peptide/nickel transport system substrate-binding protein
MKILTRAALAASLMLGACYSAMAVERGGTLTYGRYADSLFLEPVLNDGNFDIWVLSSIYDTLVLPTKDGQGVEPGLATDWRVADDGLSVALTLRKGAKFSDGSPITVDDVKWSLERAANPERGIWNFTLSALDHAETEGDDKIILKLKHTDPVFLTALSVFNTAIMPKKLFEASPGTTDDEKAKAFAEHPVGSGPFMFESWNKNSEMKLVRNPYYWAMGEDGKSLPYLDGIDFQIIPDDATRILKLQSGELNGAEFIPYARVSELKNSDKVNMELFASTRIQFVTLNVRPQLDGKDNPVANEKVREALNYAANKDAIIQIVTHGVGSPMTSYMSSATPLHAGDTPLFPYDLAKAKQLMTEAGYPNGFEQTLLVLAGNQDEVGIATALQQMWSQIGVKLTLQQVDNATRADLYRKGTFPMRLGAWTDDIADPSEITSYFAYSPTIDALHSGWKNEEVDELFKKTQSQMDPAKRKEDYARIQEIFNTSGPIVPLYQTPYPVALGQEVRDFIQIPLGNNVFREAWLSK